MLTISYKLAHNLIMWIIILVDVLYYKIIQESIILSFISKFDARPFNSLASFVTYTIGLRCDEMLNSSPGHCIYHRKFLCCIALFILLVIMIFILLRDHFDIQTLICLNEEKCLPVELTGVRNIFLNIVSLDYGISISKNIQTLY